MMVFLNEDGFVAQIVTVLIFTLFTLFVWINIEKSATWPFQLALMFMAVHLFVAAFQDEGLTGTPVCSDNGYWIIFCLSHLFESTI